MVDGAVISASDVRILAITAVVVIGAYVAAPRIVGGYERRAILVAAMRGSAGGILLSQVSAFAMGRHLSSSLMIMGIAWCASILAILALGCSTMNRAWRDRIRAELRTPAMSRRAALYCVALSASAFAVAVALDEDPRAHLWGDLFVFVPAIAMAMLPVAWLMARNSRPSTSSR